VRSFRIFGFVSGLLLILPTAGCGLFNSGPSAQEVASSFLGAFAAGDAVAASGQTDAPDAARQALDTTRRNLAPKAMTASVTKVTEGQDQTPTKAEFEASWDFGNGRVWKYQGAFELTEANEGWKVRWAPSVIHPRLAPQQTLAFQEQRPDPAPVVDRDGRQVMAPEELVTVSLDPKQAGDMPGVAGSLAGALRTVDPNISQQSIMEGAGKTRPGQPYPVATLRQADYERVKAQIYDLPGVRFPGQTKLVTAERGYGSQVMPGISKAIDDQLAAKAGWKVATVSASGADAETLQNTAPQPAQPVNTTLSDRVQRAAEQAVDPVPQGAMLVALQPSSGDVLAVAQNAGADAQGPIALTGQFPPGSTFKVVTATAALESSKVNIDSPVQCPGKKVFDGRVIPNDKEFDLGTVPLRTAFARSCNTSFAQLAVDQPAGALTDAARRLGIGVDFDIAGMTTITGKVPPAAETVQRAANGFGQGTVLASPFGMALATASVAHGSMPTPTLIRGSQTKADARPEPPSPQALEQLRPMMREVVTAGTATQLGGSGDVAGKTGTAQFGDGTRSHGWFVGYRGDLAFAVLLTDAGASAPAVEVARAFLANAG
jgi:hypothetical protein